MTAETNDDFVEVPILRGFDSDRVVGWLKILRGELPLSPDFCFSLGYRALEMIDGRVTKYELMAVSIVSDHDYRLMLERDDGASTQPAAE